MKQKLIIDILLLHYAKIYIPYVTGMGELARYYLSATSIKSGIEN